VLFERAPSSAASSDHLPGPLIIRNTDVSSCANSERTSCNTAHIPTFGGTGGKGRGEVPRYIEILVDKIATIISITNRIAMARVRKPLRKHEISVFVFQDRGSPALPSGMAHSFSFNFENWTQDGLRYFVIGDASADDIDSLSKLLRGAG
jgi:hypothetical protein